MRTIERITVTGYKSIRELRGEDGQGFVLDDINVLIGANGAGKSNLLSVFRLLKELARKRLQQFIANEGYADAVLHFGHKVTKEIKIEFSAKGHEFRKYQLTLIPLRKNTFLISKERVSNHFNQEEWDDYGSGREESVFPDMGGLWAMFLAGIFDFVEIYQFHDTSDSAPIKQHSHIFDNRSLNANAGNLASLLYRLKNHQPAFYNRIVKTVQLAAPFFDDFLLYPEPDNLDRIRLRWRHKKSDENWDVSQLSDGTLRFICLTTLLLQPNSPDLIIIDEPELGLHPYAITVLAGMLRSVSTQSQIIVSTQSVSLVNEFEPKDIIVVDRENDASTFTRLNSADLEAWLDDYKLGELWETNLIGGRP